MLKVRQSLFPSLGLQVVDGGHAHGLARDGVAEPDKNGKNISDQVNQVEIVRPDKSPRIQRIQQQFHTGEEPEAERDAKTHLLPGHSQKARKQEQKENESKLHDADRALESGKGVHQRILVEGI